MEALVQNRRDVLGQLERGPVNCAPDQFGGVEAGFLGMTQPGHERQPRGEGHERGKQLGG
jgi:hypothetical protein